MENKDLRKARNVLFCLTAIGVIFMIGCAISMTGCTIAFHNVSTSGKATDVIDETQQNEPNVSPDISIPLSGVLPNLPKVPRLDIGSKEVAKKQDKK